MLLSFDRVEFIPFECNQLEDQSESNSVEWSLKNGKKMQKWDNSICDEEEEEEERHRVEGRRVAPS